VQGFVGKARRKRDHWEDQGVGGKMGSEWILGRLGWGCGLDSTVSGQGPVAGCCECGDEPSGSCAAELVSLVTCNCIFISINIEILKHTGYSYINFGIKIPNV
jgi:hypothetical protein